MLDDHGIELGSNVRQLEPLGYLEMLALRRSGGARRHRLRRAAEGGVLVRVPCVTLRANTEWVDTVEAGANTLVDPADPEPLAAALEAATFPGNARRCTATATRRSASRPAAARLDVNISRYGRECAA